MKASIIATLMILLLAAIIGGRDRMRVNSALDTRQRLRSEATRLGITGDTPDIVGQTPSRSGSARRAPAARQAEAKDFAKRLAVFVMELDARTKEGTGIDEKMQEQIFELLDEMLRLDTHQLEALIGELRNEPKLTPEMRRNIVALAIGTLANDHPAAALAVFSKTSDLFTDPESSSNVVGDALSKWANKDPQAALAWLRENGRHSPELITDKVKVGLIGGAAKRDPRLAFRLVTELGVTDILGAGNRIADSAKTAAERLTVLDAMRDHLDRGSNDEAGKKLFESTMSGLTGKVVGEGFESAASWLAKAKLDDRETAAFIEKLHPWQTKEDTGKWVEWLGKKLPADQAGDKVGSLIHQWAQDDYRAVATWLNSTPAGLARDLALQSYVSALGPYEPAAAAQWALTLPPGSTREQLIKSVHGFWKNKDPDAAASFARQQGIPD